MVFCIAMIHAGLTAAVFAFALWSLPGAIGMYGLSLGVQKMPDRLPPIVYALLSGMNASTVGIIALAAVQLAEKAIKDRLTRVLVIFGACAGMCYNGLWYFPVLIVIGGITTVVWDAWLRQKVFKMKASYVAKMRRTRNEAGDAEDVTVTQSVPLEVLPRPEAARRRPQAGASSDPILSVDDDLTSKRVGDQSAAESPPHSQIEQILDAATHTISVKLGLSLIVSFFGESGARSTI